MAPAIPPAAAATAAVAAPDEESAAPAGVAPLGPSRICPGGIAVAEYVLHDAELVFKQWRGYWKEASDPLERREAQAIAAFAETRMQVAYYFLEQATKAAMTMPNECPECREIIDTVVKIRTAAAVVNLQNDELKAQLQVKNSEIERLRSMVVATMQGSPTELQQRIVRAERQSQAQGATIHRLNAMILRLRQQQYHHQQQDLRQQQQQQQQQQYLQQQYLQQQYQQQQQQQQQPPAAPQVTPHASTASTAQRVQLAQSRLQRAAHADSGGKHEQGEGGDGGESGRAPAAAGEWSAATARARSLAASEAENIERLKRIDELLGLTGLRGMQLQQTKASEPNEKNV